MKENYRHFSNVSARQLKKYQEATTDKVRSPALKRAWAAKREIRRQFKSDHIPMRVIADQWGINLRAAYRIVNGK